MGVLLIQYGYWFVSTPWIGTPGVLILEYPRGCRNSPLGYHPYVPRRYPLVYPNRTCRMPYSAPERCWCGELGLPGTALCLAHTPQKSGWELRPTAWKNVDGKTYRKWKKLRNRFIKENPFCNLCGMIATEVDHIDGIKAIENALTLLDENRLQSLCHECHAAKTREASRKSRNSIKKLRRGNSPRNAG